LWGFKKQSNKHNTMTGSLIGQQYSFKHSEIPVWLH